MVNPHPRAEKFENLIIYFKRYRDYLDVCEHIKEFAEMEGTPGADDQGCFIRGRDFNDGQTLYVNETILYGIEFFDFYQFDCWVSAAKGIIRGTIYDLVLANRPIGPQVIDL